MQPLPHLDLMPRVLDDIDDCLTFVACQPWGKPADRRRDIFRGIGDVRIRPKRRPVQARRPKTGVELRRYYVAQFAIVYAYFEPDVEFPAGVVSIRAIRHRRVRNVFSGVKEQRLSYRLADRFKTCH